MAANISCKVTAGLMHEVAEEERSVVLRCPLSEERRVTWSRERNDSREEILTADGGHLIRHDDITKQYTTYHDLSLYIYRAAVSHSGTYFCDDKAAVTLTVIPSGTMRLAVVGGRNVTLRCPHAGRRSGSPSWSRSFAGKQQIVCPHASTVGQMLIIPDVQLADSGLYHCDGKAAAYLKVIKEEKSDSDEATKSLAVSVAVGSLSKAIKSVALENLSITERITDLPAEMSKLVTKSRQMCDQVQEGMANGCSSLVLLLVQVSQAETYSRARFPPEVALR
ncbi:uncharacterized protein LOC120716539 [Simochromis diagramma]|uniref:uncharacterized protein LOC120716539 n=1 Tax=Simochromis diagramma TaxID=43689 RepID=UPI001A7EC4C7|nr:uncharacterized protein LOC120716539 [Simochromis diagramma]